MRVNYVRVYRKFKQSKYNPMTRDMEFRFSIFNMYIV